MESEKITQSGRLAEPKELADCPWPPTDSHCSPCTIYLDKDPIGFPIWGEYAGNDNRETFYAQAICFGDNPLKRIVFDVARSKSTAVPPGDGVYIGILDQNAMNYANKFTSGGEINQAWIDTWTVSAYLATMPGGVPTVHEQYCLTASASITTGVYYYFVMVTNGSYETCGWQMGGYGDSSFPAGTQPFYRYTEEEPGYDDGYHDVDNYFRGAIIVYNGTEDEAFILQECTIENPSFPSSHPDYTQPYDYEFDLINAKQFPCGCPSELSWVITDTSNNPLIGPWTRVADCGSYGIHVDTSETGQGIMFDGTGTITLRCWIGYISGESFIAQDYHEFTVVVGGQTYNCYKCDNPPSPCALHTGLPNPCDESTYFTTKAACEAATGCASGPTDPVIHEFLSCDATDYEHCWDYGNEGSCEGDPMCDWQSHWPGCSGKTQWNWHPPAKSTYQYREIVWIYGRFDCDYPQSWGCGGWNNRYVKYELWKEGGSTPERTITWGPLGNYTSYSFVWWLYSWPPRNYTVKAYWGDSSSCPNYLGSMAFTILTPPCEQITSRPTCIDAGCYWYTYEGLPYCHSTPPVCELINNRTDCEANGCYWYDGSCHSSLPCSSYSTQSTCEANDCYWWNGSCHDNPPSCSEINNQTDCLAYDCYWYDGSCHSDPQPQDLCKWIKDQVPGWPSQPVTDIPIQSIMALIDLFVLQQPPDGYDFIPTILEVFGVIDYYLGFNGDPGTGCDLFSLIFK